MWAEVIDDAGATAPCTGVTVAAVVFSRIRRQSIDMPKYTWHL